MSHPSLPRNRQRNCPPARLLTCPHLLPRPRNASLLLPRPRPAPRGGSKALKSKAEEILLRSRQQLLKWGLSKFLTFESIRLHTPAGKQLRKSLKVLWDRNLCDTDFQKYLGTDVDEMKSLLAMDSVPAQKALQQAPDMSSEPASSAHAPKAQGKRSQPASLVPAPKGPQAKRGKK